MSLLGLPKWGQGDSCIMITIMTAWLYTSVRWYKTIHKRRVDFTVYKFKWNSNDVNYLKSHKSVFYLKQFRKNFWLSVWYNLKFSNVICHNSLSSDFSGKKHSFILKVSLKIIFKKQKTNLNQFTARKIWPICVFSTLYNILILYIQASILETLNLKLLEKFRILSHLIEMLTK